MKIHLIRGFTKHGKSTFARKLSSELNLKIYSFASALKHEVNCVMGTSFDEERKDEVLPRHLQRDDCVTYRDWCKKIALERKSKDKFYFAKKVYEQILEDFSKSEETDVIIDDFRFPEELEYLRDKAVIQHYCVLHSTGAIPDSQDMSEHSLDHLSFEDEILVLR